MNNLFKLKNTEVILVLLIFCLINTFFGNFFFILNNNYHKYIPYLYPINYLLNYLTLFFILIYFWTYYKNESFSFQFFNIQRKYFFIYISLFLLCMYTTNLFINILSNQTSKIIIYLDDLLNIKYNISIKYYMNFMKYTLKQNFDYLYGYPYSACITIAIIAPIVEEILFRGIILQGLINYGYKKWNSLIFSSFMFGVLHVNFWQVISACILGVIIGWIYINSKSLILSIVLHLINNLIICLFYLFFKSNYQLYIHNSIVINLILLILSILTSILIIFLIKK